MEILSNLAREAADFLKKKKVNNSALFCWLNEKESIEAFNVLEIEFIVDAWRSRQCTICARKVS